MKPVNKKIKRDFFIHDNDYLQIVNIFINTNYDELKLNQ